MSHQRTEIAIVGAGIVGLAHALAAARSGRQVTVFERHPAAVGASIRNFGMIWPIGQPLGPLYDRALRSRQIWLEVAKQAGFSLDLAGSLHLAYRQDELAVLEEFAASRQATAQPVQLLNQTETAAKSPAAITDGLLAALWSATEVIVDPRVAIAQLPAFLSHTYGVTFHFGQAVTAIAYPQFTVGADRWQAEHIFVCNGADFEILYPLLYARSGLTKVKLQMMRTPPQPQQWRLGAALCGGLTLTHYAAFAHCRALPALQQRIQAETPHFPQWGIHVMVSQNALGELIIGDSHEASLNPDPFDREQINRYILDYLMGFARFPDRTIAERWHGIYAKLPGHTEWIHAPELGVTIVNALSGAGMTLAFGLAEEVLAKVC